MTDYRKYITINPDQRSGQPCIRGRHGNGPGGEPHRVKSLRITVYDVLSYLAAGDSIEEILEHFPMLTKDDVLACLAFAADAEKRFQPNA
ncbi:uncharacterized protein (DUF433 family) [Catalinimonas alkaloidigena]|uniref:DUF433 domain-containing protein n=1 Tax=Catalinimonas alkaloidigena TaxID=1075417 RepID=UPI002406DAAE|nr:DUF433 domain-containing protein [Catalinimonas alkaloidigena]MDF9796281.1 uncharacterized protein (DUF433 family) [Catalinimonas alkaloidigena]